VKGVKHTWRKALMAQVRDKEKDDREDVAVFDNGSSISGFNDIGYFVPGTMKYSKIVSVTSIIGKGTVQFMISDGEDNWKRISIPGVAFMPGYEGQVISEIQFRRISDSATKVRKWRYAYDDSY
jgi:hypothetical protein